MKLVLIYDRTARCCSKQFPWYTSSARCWRYFYSVWM